MNTGSTTIGNVGVETTVSTDTILLIALALAMAGMMIVLASTIAKKRA